MQEFSKGVCLIVKETLAHNAHDVRIYYTRLFFCSVFPLQCCMKVLIASCLIQHDICKLMFFQLSDYCQYPMVVLMNIILINSGVENTYLDWLIISVYSSLKCLQIYFVQLYWVAYISLRILYTFKTLPFVRHKY